MILNSKRPVKIKLKVNLISWPILSFCKKAIAISEEDPLEVSLTFFAQQQQQTSFITVEAANIFALRVLKRKAGDHLAIGP